jgi:hypothetical protein
MKRARLLALIMAILILMPPSRASADSIGSLRDFSVETPNGEFLFVLLARDIKDSYNLAGYIQEDPILRKTYAQSGLYRNDGSNTPLWTVDWNAYGVLVSSDGHHLMRWGPPTIHGNYTATALEFYRDGELLKDYTIDQLVANPAGLPHSVSFFHWTKESGNDDANRTFWVRTEEGRRYVFDLASGDIIEGSLPSDEALPSEGQSPFSLVVIATVVLLLAGVLGYWRWRKAQAQNQLL